MRRVPKLVVRSVRRSKWGSAFVACAFLLCASGAWADAPDKFEPDDRAFQATPLDLTGVPQTHTLSPEGDYDLFRFTLDSDSDVYFDFEALGPDPKPLLGFGLFSSSITLIRNLDDALAAASYIRLTEDTEQFGPVVRVAHLTKGTYYGVAVFVTCYSNKDCNSTPSYRIAATKLGGPDRYEPDNSAAEARWIDVNGPAQIHQFVSPTDKDWVAFYNPGPGETLTITAIQAGSLALPFIDLYASDGTTVLASSAKAGEYAKAEAVAQLVYVTQPADTGILYVRVTNVAKDGEDDSFSLSVKSGGSPLPSALAGVVTQKVTGGGGCGTPAPVIANATITIEDLGGVSTLSDSTGVYAFASIPADTYTVTASATGYTPVTKTVTVNGTTSQDFSLTHVKEDPSLASMSGGGSAGDALVLAAALALVWLAGRKARIVRDPASRQ